MPHWLGRIDADAVDAELVVPSGTTLACASAEIVGRRGGALRRAGLTHLLVELHGPTAPAHAQVSRSLLGSALPEDFDASLATIGHGRAHGLRIVVASDASRSGARVLRELGALVVRLGVETWCIHGPWTAPELDEPQLPRAALTIPFVLDAALRAERDGVTVGLVGMPLCLLGPHHVLAVPAFRPAEGLPCDGCGARPRCAGLGSRYRAAFGSAELRPIAAPEPSPSSPMLSLVAHLIEASGAPRAS